MRMSSTFQLDPYRIAGSGHFFIATTGELIPNRNVVYVAADGFFYMADASAAGTMPALGITLTQTTQNNESKILTKGFVGNPVWTWTAGDTLYVSPIAGQLTNVQPTAPDQVQQVGIALTATQIWFDPAGIGGAAGAPPTGIPVNVGAANAQGADAVNYVRRDHIHAHPDLSGLVTPAHAHADLSTVTFAQHHDHYARYLWNVFGRILVPGTSIIDRVHLLPIQIEFDTTIDRLIQHLGAPAAGNVRMCIYNDNGDTPAGGSLIVQTASVAMPGANQMHEIVTADTVLTTGPYWLGWNHDTGTDVNWRVREQFSFGGTWQGYYYNLAYGVFSDPCPAVTQISRPPSMGLRVKSVP